MRQHPWAAQQMEIERMQATINELQQWKCHAEEYMKWQVAAAVLSSPPWPSSRLDALSFLEDGSAATTTATTRSPASSPAGSTSGKLKSHSSLKNLSSLPMPMRLPVGPEPPRAPSQLKVSQSEQSFEALLQPGSTLARAASMLCDDAKDPRLQLPTGLLDDDEEDDLLNVEDSLPKDSLTAVANSLAPFATGDNACSSVPIEVTPGILVSTLNVFGSSCTRAEWRIDDLRGKLLASMGRPLVSPPFAARGLPNLRLMVFPDAREAVKGVRSRERKGLYSAMVKKGPLHGALKLKADCLERATVLRFHLTVGSVRCGPFTYDFSECAIHGCEDFGADWLKQVDERSGNLSVGVEILDVKEFADGRGARSYVDGLMIENPLYSSASDPFKSCGGTYRGGSMQSRLPAGKVACT